MTIPPAKDVSSQEFFTWLSQSKRRTSTNRRYLIMFNIVLTGCDGMIDIEHLNKFFYRLQQEGKRGKYLNNLVIAVRMYGRFTGNPALVKYGTFRQDPYQRAILTPDECQKFLNACDEFWSCAFSISVFSACRMGEIMALTKDDFDFSAGLIYVRESKTATGIRAVPIPPAYFDKLQKFTQDKTGLVFAHPSLHRKIIDAEWGRAFHYYAKLAGVEKKSLTPHGLRASALTELAEQGVNVFTLKKLAGHSKLATTERYVQTTTGDLVNAVNTHSLNRKYLKPKQVFDRIQTEIGKFSLENLPIRFDVSRTGKQLKIVLTAY